MSAMNEPPPVTYASGEEIRARDVVTYFGNPGQVEFVADPRDPRPETRWYIEEFGGGAMVLDSKIGQVFLSPERDLAMLVFVSRGDSG